MAGARALGGGGSDATSWGASVFRAGRSGGDGHQPSVQLLQGLRGPLGQRRGHLGRRGRQHVRRHGRRRRRGRGRWGRRRRRGRRLGRRRQLRGERGRGWRKLRRRRRGERRRRRGRRAVERGRGARGPGAAPSQAPRRARDGPAGGLPGHDGAGPGVDLPLGAGAGPPAHRRGHALDHAAQGHLHHERRRPGADGDPVQQQVRPRVRELGAVDAPVRTEHDEDPYLRSARKRTTEGCLPR